MMKILGLWKGTSDSLMKKVYALALALILFSLTILFMGSMVQFYMELVTLRPGVVETAGLSPSPAYFGGVILQRKALHASDVLPLYGSSEMSLLNDYHPAKLFEGKPTHFVPFLVGHGGSQDLPHLLNFGALGNDLKGKKLVVFLSPQWFSTGGIPQSTFAGNFSPLQTYETLLNPTLTSQTKHDIAIRLLDFPKALKDYPLLAQMIRAYAREPNWKTSALKVAYWPLAKIDLAGLIIEDATKTVAHVQKLSPKLIAKNALISSPSPSPSWESLRTEATHKGAALTTSNAMTLLDTYYYKYVAPRFQEMRNSDQWAKLYPSQEYHDLDLLMQILRQTGAQPLFIIIPMNGPWYDYTGIPASERKACYERLATMVQQQGFELANFSSHEYEQYYLQDPWHLAWRGWVDVDEKLDFFYHEKKVPREEYCREFQ